VTYVSLGCTRAVLNSERAIEMSVYVVHAFVQLRELLASNKDRICPQARHIYQGANRSASTQLSSCCHHL
jgi:hypothetical protein